MPLALNQLLKRRDDFLHLVRVGGLDFDHADLVAHQQQLLGILHRQEHERLVIIVDADLEDRADGVGDYRAGRCRRPSSALPGSTG